MNLTLAKNTSDVNADATTKLPYPIATIINGAWLNVEIPGRGYGHAKPYFVAFYHDAASTTMAERTGWTVACTVVTVLTIIASFANIVVYYRRGVKRDFFMLTCFLHTRNVIFSISYIYGLLVTLRTGWWEAADYACTTAFWLVWGIGGFGLVVEALISYERRLCITSNTINYKPSTLKIVGVTIFLLCLCLLLSAGFAWWPYHTYSTQWVIISGANNNQPVKICADWDYSMSGEFDTTFLVLLYYSVLVTGSSIYLGINYWKIFKVIDGLKKLRSGTHGTHGTHGTNQSESNVTASSMKTVQLADWQRREIFLVKMSLSLFLIFVISYIPGFFSTFALCTWMLGSWSVEQAWVRKFSLFCMILGMFLTAFLQCITPSHIEVIFDKFGDCKRKWRKRNRLSTASRLTVAGSMRSSAVDPQPACGNI